MGTEIVLDNLIDISETNKEINGDVIRHLLVGIFIAGTDTTSSTVEWTMSEMLKNPDIMSKAKAELKQNHRQRKSDTGSRYSAFAILTGYNKRDT
ncbi:unnamed protein product [Rhodiola kirilowii]